MWLLCPLFRKRLPFRQRSSGNTDEEVSPSPERFGDTRREFLVAIVSVLISLLALEPHVILSL